MPTENIAVTGRPGGVPRPGRRATRIGPDGGAEKGGARGSGMSQEMPSLSAREKEVVVHLSRGLTYVQIGRRLGITAWTVDTYLRRVRAKTGAATGADLVRLGLRLQPPEADGQLDRPSA